MKKGIVIPTCRLSGMLKLAETVRQCGMSDWGFYLGVDNYSRDDMLALKKDLGDQLVGLVKLEHRTAPFVSRCTLMGIFEDVDVWASLDDDIELIPGLTDYESIVNKVMERGVGLIASNWVKHENDIPKKRVEDKFIKQKVVYTGGGMLVSKDARDTLVNYPKDNYVFDNAQFSIVTYINGLENYRYLGSVAIHRILTRGGLRELRKEKEMIPLDSSLIRTYKSNERLAKGNAFLMPAQKDLTELAHNLHRENRRKYE